MYMFVLTHMTPPHQRGWIIISYLHEIMKTWVATWFLLSCLLLSWLGSAGAGQAEQLKKLTRRRVPRPVRPSYYGAVAKSSASSAASYVVQQDGGMEDDRIVELPGQPSDVYFDQYAGYVTVDSLVESPQDASTKPLVLWLNGGPGCSSLGYGAMQELGPFRVNSDGKTLYRNEYAWSNVANVLFLESPGGVGFSYSNSSSDYNTTGDQRTASDAYIFLINWLRKFPQYKSRDFYITGESFAGHYVPELADTIVSNSQITKQAGINLKGIAIGNAFLDGYFTKVDTNTRGAYDYYWSHALISDESHAAFVSQCKYPNGNLTPSCITAIDNADDEVGNVNGYSIYAPLCHGPPQGNHSTGSVLNFDPCSDYYIFAYLNLEEVKKALHVNGPLPNGWEGPCSDVLRHTKWRDMPDSILPTIQQLIKSGVRIWLYSGDTDSVVSVTSTKYSINMLNLHVETPWRSWVHEDEVGGYVVGYKGLTFVTVRGAGHEVPSYQPGRSLTMISAFLQGKLPPSARG